MVDQKMYLELIEDIRSQMLSTLSMLERETDWLRFGGEPEEPRALLSLVELRFGMLHLSLRLAEYGGLFRAPKPDVEETPEIKYEKSKRKIDEYYENLFERWEGSLEKAREGFRKRRQETQL